MEPAWESWFLQFMPNFVVPAEDLIVLNKLPRDVLRPTELEWINRGTDQRLRRMSVAMLVRTLYQGGGLSQSVVALHQSAGLRLKFRTIEDQRAFAAAFQAEKSKARSTQ